MKKWWLLVLLLSSPLAGAMEDVPLQRAVHEDWMVDRNFAGFLNKHPDLWNQRAGVLAYKRGEYGKAMMHFRKAARYADKPSQVRVAEMLWNGSGVTQDCAAAYAWADLSAEREYEELAQLRDAMWGQLNEAERVRALQIGRELYAEYGDEVAQERLAVVLRRERMNVTGSRAGFTGGAKIYALPPGAVDPCNPGDEGCDSGAVLVDGSQFYASTYWDPKQYFRWRDIQWREQAGRTGHAEVGAPQTLPAGSGDGLAPRK